MPVVVNITLPVFNEEEVLAQSVAKLTLFLRSFRHPYEIVIANNGSTDSTLEIAKSLASEYEHVAVLHRDRAGRGGALKATWLQSSADVLTYMDADLSTDLQDFPSLVEPILRGERDMAIGSRLLEPRLTKRCFKREILSRGYNVMVRRLLGTGLRDAQCGFKALSRRAAQHLLPLVDDTNWFFDTELLVLAERVGYRLLEVPVGWTERQDSHVAITRTVFEDILGVLRLRRRMAEQYRGKSRSALAISP